MRLLDGRHQRRSHLRHFSFLTLPRCQSCPGKILKVCIQLTSEDLLIFQYARRVFISGVSGPEFDH